MFGLAYGFYQWMFTKRTYNMIIVGLDGAGKTTLLEQSKTMFTDQRGRACPPTTHPSHGTPAPPQRSLGPREVSR